MNQEKSTLNYYNTYANDFIDATLNADVKESINGFIKLLPQNARILDVGCGSGRDTLNFLQHGFEVVAFDASHEVAKIASERINHPVLVKKIEDMQWSEEFDGVWAMASLLHLPKEKMLESLSLCANALKPGGHLFVSLKYGTGEGYDEKGRFFSYYQPEELKAILAHIPQLQHQDFSSSEDTLGRSVQWINIVAHKEISLEPKVNRAKKF